MNYICKKDLNDSFKMNWKRFIIFNIIYITKSINSAMKLAVPGTQCYLCHLASFVIKIHGFILLYKLC